MINDEAAEFLEERFQSRHSRYLIGLKTSMKGSDFIFDLVNLLYCKCNKQMRNVANHIKIPLIA